MPTATPSLDTVFTEAIEIPDPAARRAYLDRACGPDSALREKAGKLVAAHFGAGDFLVEPFDPADVTTAFSPAAHAEDDLGPGVAVGPYVLREQIGEGGMGLVFVAEQTHPVRRKVALKAIKPGMDSKQVIARFEAERQALALMDHPNIAKVHDAGTTDRGRPFFVMELVKGEPLTGYCDAHRLTVRDRLDLFQQVCRAVQHAHQKGVIHRDLKPSNVLVAVHDVAAVAKVIDFGIAKAVGQALTDKTVYTAVAQMVGTPLYMSPEQAGQSSLDVDTRTDVYALGVLLYELLTGTTPIDPAALRTAGYDEVRRMIREDEPARPSARLSTLNAAGATTVADRRGADPGRLSRQVRGELDWVVMKCLEKDRNRRYESAGALAEDVQRFLADEPVQARATSVAYRARKFVRRHRVGLATAAVVLAAVAAGAGTIGWSLWDAAGRRNTAEREAAGRRERAEGAAAAALSESADQHRADRPAAAMASARRAADALTGVPGTESLQAEVRDRAAELEMAATLEDIWLGAQDSGQLEGPGARAVRHEAAFREYGLDPAELTEAELVERVRGRLITPELAAGLDVWGRERRVGEGPADPLAEKLLRAAAAADPDPWSRRTRAVLADGTPDQMAALAAQMPVESAPRTCVVRLGLALLPVDRRADAEALLRRAARARPDDVKVNFTLGDLLGSSAAPEARVEALGFYRAALAARPHSSGIRVRIGNRLTDNLGRPAEGAEVFRDVIRLHPGNIVARLNLANALHKQGKLEEAAAAAREAAAAAPGVQTFHGLGWELTSLGRPGEAADAFRTAVQFGPRTAADHFARGQSLKALGRTAEAVLEYREAVRRHPAYPEALLNLGVELSQKGEYEEALAAYRAVLRFKPDSAAAHNSIGLLFKRRGREEDAAAAYLKAIHLDPGKPNYHGNLGNALQVLNRLEAAAAAYQDAIRLGPDAAEAHYALGVVFGRLDRTDEAEAAYRQAVKLQPTHGQAHCNLGIVLRRKGRFTEALTAMRRGHDLGSKDPKWPYPSAQWVKDCERLVALEPQLPGLLAGTVTPADPADALVLAALARDQKRYARAAALYRTAFALSPPLADSLRPGHGYSAACLAARAGCGQGSDASSLGDADRAGWRRQALEWLKHLLAIRQRQLAGGTSDAPGVALAALVHWQQDTDLAGVRDPAALANLPAGERGAWARFWADVQATIDRGAGPSKPN